MADEPRTGRDRALNIVITGGSKGIGLALCNLLARDHDVYTCARSPRPDGLAENVVYRAVAIDQLEEVERWIASIPSIDVLINNAALLGERATLRETTPDVWAQTMRVNVDGAFYVTRAAIDKLSKNAVICNISSSVGRKARATWGAYSVSKSALEAMTDILSAELPDAIVFSANPGGTATQMRADAFPDEDPATLPTADQIAATIATWILNPAQLDGAKLNCRDAIQ